MLRQRLISGILLATLVIVIVLVDAWLSSFAPHVEHPTTKEAIKHWLCNGLLVTLTVVVLTWLTARELLGFAELLGHHPNRPLTILFAVGLAIGPYISSNLKPWTGWYDEAWGLLWLSIALGWGFLAQATWRRTEHAIENLSTTIFIILYTGGLAGYLTRLRMEIEGPSGAVLLLFSMFLVKMTDTGAFFIGSLIGRNKLIEWLSPKKTWEGFFGGVLVSVLCAVALGSYLNHSGVVQFKGGLLASPIGLIVFGLLMGIFSVAGDLCASLLKREAAVKDSGRVIPGMGGILDVVDSPLLAAPVAWFFWTRLTQLG